ncbi:hypothetical protein [Bacillus kwashiorkori]|uniref:hypothetical protein n=1 Tax=Bacillus kwashiorkori TaxID=1522318 RepID=UPI000786647E|nr:hypothetical protein [Bacillus kwashiorkori]
MKGNKLFPSAILIGFGLYVILQNFPILTYLSLFGWPALLFLIGVAFFVQAYGGKQYDFILPAVLFSGLGIHFYLSQQYSIRLDHMGVIILFISLSFFLQYQKTNSGLLYGWLFLILAFIQLFYEKIFQWLGFIQYKIADLNSFWPIILFAVGGYLFFFKRK